ncbi:MAG TPA: SAV_6107 family HEPN domain-containing protein [Mycobacteriales bacterium]|nr:SAV_6107 family HEPN domain-containing protein [Mycobacteriales bacterium]
MTTVPARTAPSVPCAPRPAPRRSPVRAAEPAAPAAAAAAAPAAVPAAPAPHPASAPHPAAPAAPVQAGPAAPTEAAPRAAAPIPLPAPPPVALPRLRTPPEDLLALARAGLAEAAAAPTPAERYAAAHLSALRAAAAVIGARARPEPVPPRRGRPLSAWVLLAAVAPELGEWAAFFAAGARKRAAAETGLPNAVTTREADDLVRDAETFLSVVETKLGAQPQLYRGVG